ncbi:hypothetical protein BCR36DRAFT_406117 [Piromyces finnis]|uniref:Chitin synthase n=1 Tax=Piromyces finnis TaxID=1754191 RepID=A0A1Y1V1Q1_9FUNG|nr:hypothetical protein BCR36DRAFT_406117 [Piromyces finnis]|eukprot:ORX45223.1 hypothetical protein BCR36DRAFT_406117 [Piromyces finnis]
MVENNINTGQFNKLTDKDSSKNFYKNNKNDKITSYLYNNETNENIYPNVITKDNLKLHTHINSNINNIVSSIPVSTSNEKIEKNDISEMKRKNHASSATSQFKNNNTISFKHTNQNPNIEIQSPSVNPKNHYYYSNINEKNNELEKGNINNIQRHQYEPNNTVNSIFETTKKEIAINQNLNSNSNHATSFHHPIVNNNNINALPIHNTNINHINEVSNNSNENFTVPPRTTSNAKPFIPSRNINMKPNISYHNNNDSNHHHSNSYKNTFNSTNPKIENDIKDRTNVLSNKSTDLSSSNLTTSKGLSYNINTYPIISQNSNSNDYFKNSVDKPEKQQSNISLGKELNTATNSQSENINNTNLNSSDFNLRPFSMNNQDFLPYTNYNYSSNIINNVNTSNENSQLESLINNGNPFLSNNKKMPYQINDTPLSYNSDKNNLLMNGAFLNNNNDNNSKAELQNTYYQDSKLTNENNSSLDQTIIQQNKDHYWINSNPSFNNMSNNYLFKKFPTEYNDKNHFMELKTRGLTSEDDEINNVKPLDYNDNENDFSYTKFLIDDERKPLKESLLNFKYKNKNRFSKESSSSSTLSRLNSIIRSVSRSKRRSNSSLSVNSIITKKSYLGKLSGSESKNGYNIINNETNYEDYIDEDIANDIKTSDYIYKKAKSLEYLKHHKITVLPSNYNEKHNDNLSVCASDALPSTKKDTNSNVILTKKYISSPDLKINSSTATLSSPSKNKKNDPKDGKKKKAFASNSVNFLCSLHENNKERYDENHNYQNEKDFLQSSASTKTEIYDDTNPFAIDVSNHSHKIYGFNSRLSIGSNNNFVDFNKVPKIEEDKEIERLKMLKNKRKKRDRRRLNKKQKSVTVLRVLWIFLCRCLTFFIPDFVLSFFKLHERAQPLWREKITIFFFYCIVMSSFFIALNIGKIPSKIGILNREKISIHGYDYAYSDLKGIGLKDYLNTKKGEEISFLFPTYPLLEDYKENENINSIVDNQIKLNNYLSIRKDYKYIAQINNPSLICPKTDFSYTCYDINKIKKLHKTEKTFNKDDFNQLINEKKYIVVINGIVLDMEPYMALCNYYYNSTNSKDIDFLKPEFTKLIEDSNYNDYDYDITKEFENIYLHQNESALKGLSELFTIGRMENPNDYVHIIFIVICSILALSTLINLIFLPFKKKRFSKYKNNKLSRFSMPYNIVFMSVFREPYPILEAALQSILTSNYDNNKLLLCIVCDGIISDTNSSSINHILKILGIENPTHDESVIYHSIGRGRRQMNYLRVYSGYHKKTKIPYVIISKLGNKYEELNPGNRGKRDSLLILLNYLNKLHDIDSSFTPAEYELHYHLTDRLGLSPKVYKYLSVVDADTCVFQNTLYTLTTYLEDHDNQLAISGLISHEYDTNKLMAFLYNQFIKIYQSQILTSDIFLSRLIYYPCSCCIVYRIFKSKTSEIMVASDDVLYNYGRYASRDTLHVRSMLELGEDKLLPILLVRGYNEKIACIPELIGRTKLPEREKYLNILIEVLFFFVIQLIFALASMNYHSHGRDNTLSAIVIFSFIGKIIFYIYLPLYSIYHMNNLKWKRNHGTEEIHQDFFEMVAKNRFKENKYKDNKIDIDSKKTKSKSTKDHKSHQETNTNTIYDSKEFKNKTDSIHDTTLPCITPNQSYTFDKFNNSIQSINPNNISSTTIVNNLQNKNNNYNNGNINNNNNKNDDNNIVVFNNNNTNDSNVLFVNTTNPNNIAKATTIEPSFDYFISSTQNNIQTKITSSPIIMNKTLEEEKISMNEKNKKVKSKYKKEAKNINYNYNPINQAFMLDKSIKTSWDTSSIHSVSSNSGYSHSHSKRSKLIKKGSVVSLDKRSQTGSIQIKSSPKIGVKKKTKLKKSQSLQVSSDLNDEFEHLQNKTKHKKDVMVVTTNGGEDMIDKRIDNNKKGSQEYSRHLRLEEDIRIKNDKENSLDNLNSEKILFKDEFCLEKPEQLKSLPTQELTKQDEANLLVPPAPVIFADSYNRNNPPSSIISNDLSFDVLNTKNLGNDSTIIAKSRMNSRHSSSDDILYNNDISGELSQSVIAQLNSNNEIINESSFTIQKSNFERPTFHVRKRSYSLNINSQNKFEIKRSNSNKLENFTTSMDYEEANEPSIIDNNRDSMDLHPYHSNSDYFSSNSRISLPQRYQRGQIPEKNMPMYAHSRTSRISISSSTTSVFPNKPRIVSGTTYGSDYNPSNTTYSIISITDVDYISWRESASTNTTSGNLVSLLQDIHDEVFFLLKGTRDNPISSKTIRKHFSIQHGSSMVDSYGKFIDECVKEFYQDGSPQPSRLSTPSSFSFRNSNNSSNNRQYGSVSSLYRTSLMNNASQSQSLSQNQYLSQSQSFSRNSFSSSLTESRK